MAFVCAASYKNPRDEEFASPNKSSVTDCSPMVVMSRTHNRISLAVTDAQ
jgi:hypothetical protein